jgi:hypothetical protein
MNLFRATMHPVSFCTSLMQVGAFMLVMAVSAIKPYVGFGELSENLIKTLTLL